MKNSDEVFKYWPIAQNPKDIQHIIINNTENQIFTFKKLEWEISGTCGNMIEKVNLSANWLIK